MAMKQPEHYILAIDQGTSVTRAMLFDHSGRKVIESEKSFPQYYPHNAGWKLTPMRSGIQCSRSSPVR